LLSLCYFYVHTVHCYCLYQQMHIYRGWAKVGLQLWVRETRSLFLYYFYLFIIVLFVCIICLIIIIIVIISYPYLWQ
jgi:hypothetical protein